MRRDLERLVEQLARLDVDLTLTTNGSLLTQKAQAARRRGTSPDHSQPRLARRRAVPGAQRRRLPRRAGARGHRGRERRGLARQGERGHQARRRTTTRSSRWPLTSASAATRSGSSSTWTSATRTAGGSTMSCPAREIVGDARTRSSASSRSSLPTAARSHAATAIATARGEVGVIASVTQPFCGDCTRARLSAEGKLFTCLFAVRGHDLRAVLRGGRLRRRAGGGDRRRLGRAQRPLFRATHPRDADLQKVEMSYIGG